MWIRGELLFKCALLTLIVREPDHTLCAKTSMSVGHQMEEMSSHSCAVRFNTRYEAKGVNCLPHDHMTAVEYLAADGTSSVYELGVQRQINHIRNPLVSLQKFSIDWATRMVIHTYGSCVDHPVCIADQVRQIGLGGGFDSLVREERCHGLSLFVSPYGVHIE